MADKSNQSPWAGTQNQIIQAIEALRLRLQEEQTRSKPVEGQQTKPKPAEGLQARSAEKK